MDRDVTALAVLPFAHLFRLVVSGVAPILAGGRVMEQAETYETQGDLADRVFQVINTAFKTHPFGTVRAAELQRWVRSGKYDAILNGDYPRRGDPGQPLSEDYVDAAGYYGNQAREAFTQVGDVLARARDAFNNAFKTSDS